MPTPEGLTALQRTYRVIFRRYLAHRDEVALADAYELGRGAFAAGTGVLELARVHHDVLVEELDRGPDEPVAVAEGASRFLLEVLASHDLACSARRAPPAD